MIQLRDDALIFKMPDGESIPCSAALVTVELIGDSADHLDSELVQHAANAVLQYFKKDQGRDTVSVGEFAEALAGVLRSFGVKVSEQTDETPYRNPVEADLRTIACESGKGFELAFFPRLREVLHAHLRRSPSLIRFHGLRGCVKQLTGARRWTAQCQQLSDQIVDFLRQSLGADATGRGCALLVS